ncbi:hypothetical protein [Alkaliphilus sp. B6464]|uniref:hypothetical protein n=1 Tax=Alkaliphilus sp. B6464 TaxID=2731219 RepID=UPI001BAD62F6|nr:hypothetical protein [Alkaliphilus sp. B6464]QUH20586.1 hypothetical protein HYG84_12350 [Alkaliphilus sp. B6464]
MDALIGGTLGKVLNDNYHNLYEAIQKTDKCAVIRGEVQKDSDLHYIRNAIGFVQALVEKGVIVVLDLQTFTLYTPSEWTSKIFDPKFDPYTHVVILTSEMEDGSIWLHTQVIPSMAALECALQFFHSQERPSCIEWEELYFCRDYE